MLLYFLARHLLDILRLLKLSRCIEYSEYSRSFKEKNEDMHEQRWCQRVDSPHCALEHRQATGIRHLQLYYPPNAVHTTAVSREKDKNMT